MLLELVQLHWVLEHGMECTHIVAVLVLCGKNGKMGGIS